MGILVKILALVTALGALHSCVHWYTQKHYMSETLGAQSTMAIQTVVGLAAVGLMIGVFKKPKGKKA
ncbi:MAG: hypothetical protein ACYTGZ_22525 [Planctomycetota bacterium]|jgi:hypothetical protein